MKLTPSPSPTNGNTSRWLVMTLAVGLIDLVAVALACAPTTTPGQETPTAEPTDTPEPTATLYLMQNGTPWPVDHPPVRKWEALEYQLEELYTERTTGRRDSGQRSATPEQEVVVLITTDPAHIQSIVKFLRDNKVRPTYGYRHPPPLNDGYGTGDQLAVVLPVSLLAQLAELPGVIRVAEESGPGKVGNSGPPGSRALPPPDAHGADDWHDAGYEGRGMKVGIIDSGFRGFRTRMKPTLTVLPNPVKSMCYASRGAPPTTTDMSVCENDENSYHGETSVQAVIRMSPDADIYIANPHSLGQLSDVAKWFAEQGVNVIDMSLDWRWDGPGVWVSTTQRSEGAPSAKPNDLASSGSAPSQSSRG